VPITTCDATGPFDDRVAANYDFVDSNDRSPPPQTAGDPA
jgi:hypothetical protein